MNLENEMIVFEEKACGDVLTILVEVKLQRCPSEKKKNFFAKDLLPILEKRYNVKAILKCERICNFLTNTLSNTGTWEYEIVEKKPAAHKKKSSTNNSIRDRMSNISNK